MDGRSDLKPSIGRQKRFANSGRYMTRQPFVDRLHIVVAGASFMATPTPFVPRSSDPDGQHVRPSLKGADPVDPFAQ
jgi:hypothetical protein